MLTDAFNKEIKLGDKVLYFSERFGFCQGTVSEIMHRLLSQGRVKSTIKVVIVKEEINNSYKYSRWRIASLRGYQGNFPHVVVGAQI